MAHFSPATCPGTDGRPAHDSIVRALRYDGRCQACTVAEARTATIQGQPLTPTQGRALVERLDFEMDRATA